VSKRGACVYLLSASGSSLTVFVIVVMYLCVLERCWMGRVLWLHFPGWRDGSAELEAVSNGEDVEEADRRGK